ncbi:MAG: c-type cytochrome, partial [Chitinophagaceae bacterium]|nr:c-type cytochrome [Chitinophagaceae bacterium]
RMLFNDIKDPWMQIAALSAASLQPELLLAEVIGRFDAANAAFAAMTERLSEMIAATESIEKIRVLIVRTIEKGQRRDFSWEAPVMEGIAAGIGRNDSITLKGLQAELPMLIKAGFDHPDKAVRSACYHLITVIGLHKGSLLDGAVNKAIAIASDTTKAEDRRAEALRFVKLDPSKKHIPLLEAAAEPGSLPELQIEALKAFDKIPGTAVSEFVLNRWSFMTPEVREVALSTFMEDTARMNLLMGAVEKGDIQKTAIGWPRTMRLMSHGDENIRNRARLLFTQDDEKEVIKSYQEALRLKGDTGRGKAVFVQYCIACHQKRGELGIHYGPDLGSVRNWLPKDIMANILSPNLSIAAGFDLWELETKSGEKVQGILSSESSSAVTLLVGPGTSRTYNRQNIKTLKALNASAMTEGFAEKINQQQMADLISFLKE